MERVEMWRAQAPAPSGTVPTDAEAIAANAHLAIIASSTGRDWHGLYAEEVWHRPADFGLPAIPDHLLVSPLGRPLRVRGQVGGRERRLGEGSLTILPAEAPTQWQLGRQGDVRHLHLYLRPTFIGAGAAQAGVLPGAGDHGP